MFEDADDHQQRRGEHDSPCSCQCSEPPLALGYDLDADFEALD
jgi:hypothetical protein